MMKRKWTFRRVIRTVWMAAGLAFIAWLVYSYKSHGVDTRWVEDSTTVQVALSDAYYSFTPAVDDNRVLIFFPGALVDPRAYVPLCRRIADHGVRVYLIRMPFRMAMYGYRKPLELTLMDDTTKTYILAGHSQGAKMAAQFVYEYPDAVDKLVRIGTTHPRDISLAGRTLPVLKIFGSLDGVANESDIHTNRINLPPATEFVRIEGGNHTQFGYYGFQFGDHEATITREQQQDETLQHILRFID